MNGHNRDAGDCWLYCCHWASHYLLPAQSLQSASSNMAASLLLVVCVCVCCCCVSLTAQIVNMTFKAPSSCIAVAVAYACQAACWYQVLTVEPTMYFRDGILVRSCCTSCPYSATYALDRNTIASSGSQCCCLCFRAPTIASSIAKSRFMRRETCELHAKLV